MEAQELNKSTLEETDYLEGYYPENELSESETDELVRQVNEKAARSRGVRSFVKHLRALGSYLFDRDVRWYRKAVVAAALIYFLTPVDSIPDFVPFAGFLDDLGVIAWVVKFLGKEIEGYYN